jgi:hypothetical protein
MRKAAIVVVAALLTMLLADLVFARLVERTAADELERRTGAGAAAVDVRSFPLVESLVRRGEVREVTVRLEDVVSNGVPLAMVTLTGVDVGVDRTDAVRGDLRITRLDRADIMVEISEDDISAVFGVDVDLEIDRLTLSIDGKPSPLSAPVVEDRELILEGELGRLTLPLPGEEFLPCDPAPVVLDDRLVLLCSSDRLPRAFGGIANDAEPTPDELDEVQLVDPSAEDRGDGDIPDPLGRAGSDDTDE